MLTTGEVCLTRALIMRRTLPHRFTIVKDKNDHEGVQSFDGIEDMLKCVMLGGYDVDAVLTAALEKPAELLFPSEIHSALDWNPASIIVRLGPLSNTSALACQPG